MFCSIRNVGLLFFVSSGVAGGLFSMAPALGQTPVPVGTVALPPPDINAASSYSETSFRYSSTGTLYAWDGQTIWQQAGSSFDAIGTVQPNNSADPGQINLSADGSQILVSNGAGGSSGGPFNGEIFRLPAPASVPVTPVPQAPLVGTVPYNFDLLPVPAASPLSAAGANFFADVGSSDFSSSSVALFNSSNGSSQPLITNVPGASSFLAINPAKNALYVEDGYGDNPADTGDIRSFSLSALASGPMNFSQGTLFDTAGFGAQAGNGLFFDKDGYLFSVGQNGITVFNPQGAIVYQQDPTGSFADDATIAYDPATDQVLQAPTDGSNNATLYNAVSFEPVPEPASASMLAVGSVLALGRRRR